MDKKAKTLWQTHLRTSPSDDAWEKFLKWAQIMVSKGANFMATIYQKHYEARQKENQSPTSFDTYLNPLESVMDERSQAISAMDLFTRLTKELRARMEMSGREQLLTTRQEMVAFA